MEDEYIGTIKMFAFNFVPKYWAACNGATLLIAQNTALYSLIGTTYGGDGVTTFALPDFRSRYPVCAGQGTNLAPYVLGQIAGAESVSLTIGNMPSHSHNMSLSASSATKLSSTPAANNLGGANIYTNAPTDSTMAVDSVKCGMTGNGQSFGTVPPYLAVNFCICMQGIFPSRN
ncbi:MAG TPA: tail fiber protein [Pyrinomonadaceae bacterium]|jgi:microcystin-dependent protein|nr:tail fiber protein [Pyrinomonadaceae bacterium]